MSMPSRLSNYLNRCGTRFEVFSHAHSHSSAETARLAHVRPYQLAKSVILEDHQGCVMAVVPGDARVDVGSIAHILGRQALHLSDELRVAELFSDCDLGAVPAIGMAWGMETVVDEALDGRAEVYVEAGDHEMLLRIPGDEFRHLMQPARHGCICQPTRH